MALSIKLSKWLLWFLFPVCHMGAKFKISSNTSSLTSQITVILNENVSRSSASIGCNWVEIFNSYKTHESTIYFKTGLFGWSNAKTSDGLSQQKKDLSILYLRWNQSTLGAVTLSPLQQVEWHTNHFASLTKWKGKSLGLCWLKCHHLACIQIAKSLHHFHCPSESIPCIRLSSLLT